PFLPAHRKTAGEPRLGDRDPVQERASPAFPEDRRGRTQSQRPGDAHPAARGNFAQGRGQDPGTGDADADREHGLLLRLVVPGRVARRLRTVDPRLHARRSHPLRPGGRGGTGLGPGRPRGIDLGGAAWAVPPQLRRRELGAGGGRRPDRARWAALEAPVSTSTGEEAGRPVVSERVFLHAHGQVARHLASMVAPLLIPDLPVMLWWPKRPHFGSELFRELADLSDRLVVDTEDGFEDRDLTHLLEVARRRHARCAIGDFTWARLMPWRHLTAQHFAVAANRARLSYAQGISVLCGEGRLTQGRLLAGWVRSRLRTVGIDVPYEIRQDDAVEPGVCRFMLYTG